MAKLTRIASTPRKQSASLCIAYLAERQWGVISRTQALGCGLSNTGIWRWMKEGRLHRLHPGIYMVGHRRLGIQGRLVAALLHAGNGAALSHTTAAWWWGLLAAVPRRLHVSAPGRTRSFRELCVHHPRRVDAVRHRGFPVTTVARTLLDISATLSFGDLRRALAEADHRRFLDPGAVREVIGHGRPGSGSLRRALASHNPRLAKTLSVLEERFLALCETADIPQPEVNARVGGLMVDALWQDERVIAELDGHASHRTVAAIERDRDRELILRATGYRVLRYTWQQVTARPELVVVDLRRELGIL
jgi:hypothetical protein